MNHVEPNYYNAYKHAQSVRTPRKRKKRWWWVIILLIIISAFNNISEPIVEQAYDDYMAEEDIQEQESEPVPKPELKPDTNYLTSASWALDSHYMFAVETEFDGDIFEAGAYHFYPSCVFGLDTGSIPVVWDIYVSNNMYSSLNQLSEKELAGSVGGQTQLDLSLELEAGQYVYIKYNPVANNSPTGILEIEKQ